MKDKGLSALCLAPLIGASQSLVQALVIGLLTLCLVSVHRLLMTPLRERLEGFARDLASLTLAAALVSCAVLALKAWALPLSQQLGIYPELIAVQCLLFEHLLGRRAPWRRALALLLGFAVVLATLGAVRELLATASLDLTFGAGPTGLRLAPGAFLLLALGLALFNRARSRRAVPDREGNR